MFDRTRIAVTLVGLTLLAGPAALPLPAQTGGPSLLSGTAAESARAPEIPGLLESEPVLHVAPGVASWTLPPVVGEAALRVSGPGGLFWHQRFEATQSVEVTLESLELARRQAESVRREELSVRGNEPLEDGTYRWELRDMAPAGRNRVWRGHITVTAGSFDAARPDLHHIAQTDQVVADDLIAERVCVGATCIDGESFGPEQLKIKGTTPSLLFDSASSSNWRIDIDSASSRFSLGTLTGTTKNEHFVIDNVFKSNGLFLDANGLGVNTSTPGATLHLLANDQNPSIVFDYGTGAPSWQIRSNFLTGTFHIGPWAPTLIEATSSLSFASQSNAFVTLGRNDTTIVSSGSGRGILYLRSGGSDAYTAYGSDLFGFNVGYGPSLGTGAGFLNIRPTPGSVPPNPSIRFMVANRPALILDNEGYLGISRSPGFNPAHPIELESGAHVTTGGVWTNASSRTLKTDIEPLQATEALAAFEQLEPVRFRYAAEPEETYLGFIAEDVPEAVAHSSRASLSPMDVVALLTEVVQLQERRLDLQAEELTRLRLEVARLSRESDAP